MKSGDTRVVFVARLVEIDLQFSKAFSAELDENSRATFL
jgi:hypothetical protein